MTPRTSYSFDDGLSSIAIPLPPFGSLVLDVIDYRWCKQIYVTRLAEQPSRVGDLIAMEIPKTVEVKLIDTNIIQFLLSSLVCLFKCP